MRKTPLSAKEIPGIGFKTGRWHPNCCERSESNAKEIVGLKPCAKERYLFLSLLSPIPPPSRPRVSRARVRKKTPAVAQRLQRPQELVTCQTLCTFAVSNSLRTPPVCRTERRDPGRRYHSVARATVAAGQFGRADSAGRSGRAGLARWAIGTSLVTLWEIARGTPRDLTTVSFSGPNSWPGVDKAMTTRTLERQSRIATPLQF